MRPAFIGSKTCGKYGRKPAVMMWKRGLFSPSFWGSPLACGTGFHRPPCQTSGKHISGTFHWDRQVGRKVIEHYAPPAGFASVLETRLIGVNCTLAPGTVAGLGCRESFGLDVIGVSLRNEGSVGY